MEVTRRRALFALATAATILLAAPAIALTLNEARDQGLVAEGLNGYLIVVNQSAASLAADINNQRRAVYQSTAAETGQPLSVVEALAGERQINNAQAGWLIQTSSGIKPK